MTPTETRIAQILERLAAATPGPWEVEHVGPHGAYEGGCNVVGPDGQWVANDVFAAACDDPDDAHLIANAPADLQFLLAQVEEMGARLEATKQDRSVFRERSWALSVVLGRIDLTAFQGIVAGMEVDDINRFLQATATFVPDLAARDLEAAKAEAARSSLGSSPATDGSET